MIYGRLSQELSNDPLGRGYAGMTDQEVADSLNTENIEVQSFSFTGGELLNAIDRTEYQGLTDQEKENIRMMIQAGGTLDASSGTTVRSILLNAFGSESTTAQNLLDIATRQIARWEEVGLGEPVQPYHVNNVRS